MDVRAKPIDRDTLRKRPDRGGADGNSPFHTGAKQNQQLHIDALVENRHLREVVTVIEAVSWMKFEKELGMVIVGEDPMQNLQIFFFRQTAILYEGLREGHDTTARNEG